MTQRFVTEFIIASIAATISVAAISAYLAPELTFESFFWQTLATSAGIAVSQWLVLRRYVSWAQWWAHATMFGDFAASTLVSQLMNFNVVPSERTNRVQVFVTLVTGLGAALAQFPTLYGRVKDAWLWLVACGAAQPLAYVLLEVVFPGGPNPEWGNYTIVYSAAFNVATIMAQAAALTWMLQEELEGAPPRRTRHTPLEFLIAWCVVPITVFKMVQAFQYSSGISMFRLAMMVGLVAGGQWWVLSNVAAITTLTRRMLWVAAAVLVWAAGFTVIHTDFNGPVIFGLAAGLATGAVLLLMNRFTYSAVAVEPSSNEPRL